MVSLQSVRVRARYSLKDSLFVLYFMHLYSADGATGVPTLRTCIQVAARGSQTTALLLSMSRPVVPPAG